MENRNLWNIKFDREPVCGDNDKYIKLVMLDSVVRKKKMYYPQTLLKECKYEIKKIFKKNI